MLHKTRGIVIKFIKYRDTSIIVNIFTEAFGMQTYIVNGVRSKKSKGRIALYQPLTLLDMVVYHKEEADINRISEVKCAQPFATITTDIRKSCIALFLTEVLHKSVKEQQDVEYLFTYLYQAIQVLDHLDRGYENFHLQFLLKLTKYLGFGGEQLAHGELVLMLSKEHMLLVDNLYKATFDDHTAISHSDRLLFLNKIIAYYQHHIDHFGNIKSLEVLSEVLKE